VLQVTSVRLSRIGPGLIGSLQRERTWKTFIGKQKKLISGAEELLYGPDVLGKEFHRMLALLSAYKYAKGHCNVRHQDPSNKKLGNVSSINISIMNVMFRLFHFSPVTFLSPVG
jgi:hypothetical protein